jgi:hypothetical protein
MTQQPDPSANDRVVTTSLIHKAPPA